MTAAVGLPIVIGGQMYNCGAVISGGKLQGLVPKTYLPNYSEFYERRWFSSSEDMPQKSVTAAELGLVGEDIPVGRDLLFSIGDGTLMGMEICEDLWTPMAPSTLLALNGAEVIVNLSASNETVGTPGSGEAPVLCVLLRVCLLLLRLHRIHPGSGVLRPQHDCRTR